MSGRGVGTRLRRAPVAMQTAVRALGCRRGNKRAGTDSVERERSMFNAFKDKITSKAAKAHWNTLLARYGEVQELRIDSAQRRMEVVCLLEGETDSIAITVEKYEITDSGGK